MKSALIFTLLAAWFTQAAVRASTKLDLTTQTVSMSVPVSAFDPSTGNAVVSIPQAILGLVQSTVAWSITVRSGSSTFSNGGSIPKAVSDLGIRPSGGSQYMPLSTSSQTVANGSKTGGRGWANQNFDLSLHVSLSDAPGSYTANLIFTILAKG